MWRAHSCVPRRDASRRLAEGYRASFNANTKTLLAFAEHGKVGSVMPRDGGDCEQILSSFTKAGVDLTKLAADLQSQGAKSFDESWQDLLTSIDTKSKALK